METCQDTCCGEEQNSEERSRFIPIFSVIFNASRLLSKSRRGKDKQLTPKKDFTYNETNNPEDNNTNIDQAIKNSSQRLLV